MRDCLSLRALQKAAHRTAELYGLKCPTREEMTRMYNSANHYQQPVITCCENGMMWVDRYYVAYQLGAGNVCYTYLTRYHIAEEYASCRQAAKERGKNVSLPRISANAFWKPGASWTKMTWTCGLTMI